MADIENDELLDDGNDNIIPVSIEDEMRTAYIDYSMSVIVSRALPDVRDGLKPVHRRVLYGMADLGVYHNKAYKKSARIVGEVLGKYHPHGDSSVYETMVRMAQEWSLRYMLVDGQGNFGSIDGDNAAAMRYTEARMQRLAEEMLADLNKDVVDFVPNFDDSLTEPSVLPAKVPNLLVNGSAGIAVGMATNMAPHNLTEVVDGTIEYIKNPEITVEELTKYVTAPDFPTGGIIYGYTGVKKALETGRGRIVMRAVANIETDKNGREQIIVTEVPYQTNKASLIEKTAALVNEKRIEGISAIRDESDRKGLRIVYDIKRDAMANVVLNQLFKYTGLQTSFSVNNVALVKGRPKICNLRDLIHYYVEHRHEVVTRRTEYDLKEAKKRLHILEGLLKALDVIDLVIATIRSSQDAEEARNVLMGEGKMNTDSRFFKDIAVPNNFVFDFSEIQAKEILGMRLQRLTGLERNKIQNEHDQLVLTVEDYEDILAKVERRMAIITDELIELKEKYGDERRTQIVHSAEDIDIEDLIAEEEMVITISNEGYIKRTSLSEYKAQARGGKGSKGTTTKEDDFTEHLFVASTHNYLLIFTDYGKVYWLKVYAIPEGSKTSKGRPLQNLISIESGEKVQAVINVKNLKEEDYVQNHNLVFCTKKGQIKKTALEAYSRPRQGGINAITINEGDALLDVRLTDGSNEIIMAVRSGRAIRFDETQVRPMGRTAAGVRGISVQGDDEVIGMVCLNRPDANLLVVSEKGYGKRSDIDDYRIIKRGGKGVTTLKTTEKTGALIAIKEVVDTDHLMIIRKSGVMIRFAVSELRTMGRATQGVRLINLAEGDEIASVAKIEHIEEDEEETTLESGMENADGEVSADLANKADTSSNGNHDKNGNAEADESSEDVE
ncbi:DNA gyrase subunit A [Bernardetia sp.]|uniref:DNA gyrase subunit A n=1 Tax=Bernardetia sp. TaxID=1937974 RepID=UPI0025BAB0E6|nr:DNA gyrase subunit A [Bernardetia sp.]